MFGKLLKYEFKAAGKLYGVLFLILAIVSSILVRCCLTVYPSGELRQMTLSQQSIHSLLLYSFQPVLHLLFLTLSLPLDVSIKIFLVVKHTLTWTLPANAHQIILSK